MCMQIVSDAWKDIQSRDLVNESHIRLSISITDPDAIDASSQDNGHIYVSNVASVASPIDESIVKYATLEQDAWRCDGSYLFAPQDTADDRKKLLNAGYIGNALSGTDGAFAVSPTVTLHFAQPHEALIPGISVIWSESYDEYAVDFRVEVRRGDALVAARDVVDNASPISTIWMDIAGYDAIAIIIRRWSCVSHYPRMEKMAAGIIAQYGKSELISFAHESSSDVLNGSLPSARIDFALDNSDDSYDPNNPSGMSRYLMERQEIEAQYGLTMDNGTIEWIPAGIYYLSEWDAPQNGIDARFVARDITELLQGMYTNGVYDSKGASLYDLAHSVLESAGIPLGRDGQPRWVLDDALRSITTTAPLPLSSRAECLQLIAHAASCPMWHDRSGRLHIGQYSATDAADYMIDDTVQLQRPEISLQKPLKGVNVKTYEYYLGDASEQLYEGRMAINGTQTITLTYTAPAHNASAVITGGTLVSAKYYAYTCVLTITASGEVSIRVNGTPVLNSVRDHTLMTESVDGEMQEVDNPLISSDALAASVAKYTSDNLSMRRVFTLRDWRADPRLDAGDSATITNRYSSEAVRLTRVRYDFSGAFHGSGDARIKGA